jgi:hypothetical protein
MTQLSSPDTREIPALLLVLGPSVARRVDHLRRYQLLGKAFREEGVTSLRKAHEYCEKHSAEWNVDDGLVASWQTCRTSAATVERLFQRYFRSNVSLFNRLGEGMAWLGFTDKGKEALAIVDDFLRYEDSFKDPLADIGNG